MKTDNASSKNKNQDNMVAKIEWDDFFFFTESKLKYFLTKFLFEQNIRFNSYNIFFIFDCILVFVPFK